MPTPSISKGVHPMNPKIKRALAVSVFALGLGGGVGAAVVGGGHSSHASASAVQADPPNFACIGLLNTYGICIGPPTNY